ncbi:MAG: transposase [Flavobacteriales bacterium]|nr:transposase [Flavobacteriales bacterium]
MKHWIGIDVSSKTLDFALLDEQGAHLESAQVGNDRKAVMKLMAAWRKRHAVEIEQSLICLEPTGHYTLMVLNLVVEQQWPMVGASARHPTEHGHQAGEERQSGCAAHSTVRAHLPRESTVVHGPEPEARQAQAPAHPAATPGACAGHVQEAPERSEPLHGCGHQEGQESPSWWSTLCGIRSRIACARSSAEASPSFHTSLRQRQPKNTCK